MKVGADVPVGDGPCTDCGLNNPFIWFTDNTVWNAVCRDDNQPEPTLCPSCFVRRIFTAGYRPNSFRLIPEWPWVKERQP